MNPELLQRGALNIRDAAFVRRVFAPSAFEAGRWNVVVFECFRSLELLVKGMWCLSEHAPRRSHEVHLLLDDFIELLGKSPSASPFLIAAVNEFDNGYLIHSDGHEIQLLRRSDGLYTQLGGMSGEVFLSVDRLLVMDLVIEGSSVRLMQADKPMLTVTDSVPVDLGRTVHTRFRPPDSKAAAALQTAARELRASREDAFFGTSQYDEHDARKARETMEAAWAAAQSFVVGEV